MSYRFDPEFLPVLGMLPDTPIDDAPAARARYESTVKAFSPAVDASGMRVEDKMIPGYEGSPEVRVRVYIPENRQGNKTPALLQIHGGGFVIGSVDTEHAVAARHARELGIVVVSVDYRLAPENPYPAGLHDCYAALTWLHASADELGVYDDSIAVYGVSAGGGLAAGLSLMVRDNNGPDICFLCLNIPELDDRLTTTSATDFVDTPVWNRPKAEISWNYYLGKDLPRGSADVPIYAAPARATNLSGLPSTYVCVMEFDPLRDEGLNFAAQLMRDGVPVELHAYPGTFHGSSMFPAKVSKRQLTEILDVLRRGLELED